MEEPCKRESNRRIAQSPGKQSRGIDFAFASACLAASRYTADKLAYLEAIVAHTSQSESYPPFPPKKNISSARDIPAGSIHPTFFYILPPWRSPPWLVVTISSRVLSFLTLLLSFLSFFFCVLMGSRKVQEN